MLREKQSVEISVDKEFARPKIIVQQFIVVAAAIALSLFLLFLGFYLNRVSDPYIQQVLSLKGDRIKGHAIFEINCSGCHNRQSTPNVGPNLQNLATRKSKVKIIDQVISGKTPPMPKFHPKPQEMADLLSYLEEF
ncbi:MAG: cytochrome c [Prochloraceae cyanobacterium]|nr:cytochrome c [Prochloraceae cyanobacterium]